MTTAISGIRYSPWIVHVHGVCRVCLCRRTQKPNSEKRTPRGPSVRGIRCWGQWWHNTWPRCWSVPAGAVPPNLHRPEECGVELNYLSLYLWGFPHQQSQRILKNSCLGSCFSFLELAFVPVGGSWHQVTTSDFQPLLGGLQSLFAARSKPPTILSLHTQAGNTFDSMHAMSLVSDLDYIYHVFSLHQWVSSESDCMCAFLGYVCWFLLISAGGAVALAFSMFVPGWELQVSALMRRSIRKQVAWRKELFEVVL